MLTTLSAFFNISLIYILSFPIGYLTLLLAKPKRLANLPFFMRLPIYLASGMLIVTLLLYFLAFLTIQSYILPAISALSLVLISIYYVRSNSFPRKWVIPLSLDNILPAFLFAIIIIYFSLVLEIMIWPPAGDVFNHGMFTSILSFNQKLTPTLYPYSATPTFPMLSGIHVISASMVLLTGLLPGESVFVMGAAITILIPMLLASMTYLLTNSKMLSLMSFLSIFIIGQSLAGWVLGFFYNGPYPNLFGFLSVLLFIIFDLLLMGFEKTKSGILLMVLALACIFVVYPDFTFLTLAYSLLMLLYRWRLSRKPTRLPVKKIILVCSLILISTVAFLLVALYSNLFTPVITSFVYYASRLYARSGYAISLPLLYNSAIGLAIIFSGVFSIIMLKKHIYRRLALFYLLFLIPCLLSLIPALFPAFSILMPSRAIMVCSLISWVIISLFLSNEYFQKIRITFSIRNKIRRLKILSPKLTSVIIILVVFLPSLSSAFAFTSANNYSWLMRHGLKDDYDTLLWGSENISADELIMNDYSYTSRYFLSFSFKNVTQKIYFNNNFEKNCSIDVQEFWKTPTDTAKLLQLIKLYNVSYILLTSERSYTNWTGIGGDGKYVGKPYSPAQYMSLLDEVPFLKLVYGTPTGGFFEVLPVNETEETGMQLNGSTSYLAVKDSASLSSNETTISFWMKPSKLPVNDTIVFSKLTEKDGYQVGWRWNKRVALYLGGGIALQSNKTFSKNDLNKWWQVSITFDSSRVYLYINGTFDSTATYNGTITQNDSPLLIGCTNAKSPFGFMPAATLDDVKIYNTALPYDTIAKLYENQTVSANLVLSLDFNEDQGNTAYDHSGNNNNAVLVEAQWVHYPLVSTDIQSYRL